MSVLLIVVLLLLGWIVRRAFASGAGISRFRGVNPKGTGSSAMVAGLDHAR